MRELRGKMFSMVFKTPMTSLNPTMTVGAQIAEAVRAHQKDMGKEEVEQRGTELMQLVGIEQAEERKKAYPYHFSGGMRQRIVLAIALAGNPEILFADEPTTALDVTIQAQILDLMLEKSAYRMTAETRNKCLEICENACQEPNFGNGRYVRNLLDHAVMRQAERLFRENRGGELSKEEACMLQAEDFDPIGMEKKDSRKIGF